VLNGATGDDVGHRRGGVGAATSIPTAAAMASSRVMVVAVAYGRSDADGTATKGTDSSWPGPCRELQLFGTAPVQAGSESHDDVPSGVDLALGQGPVGASTLAMSARSSRRSRRRPLGRAASTARASSATGQPTEASSACQRGMSWPNASWRFWLRVSRATMPLAT
jgi:hypothetical protein